MLYNYKLKAIIYLNILSNLNNNNFSKQDLLKVSFKGENRNKGDKGNSYNQDNRDNISKDPLFKHITLNIAYKG